MKHLLLACAVLLAFAPSAKADDITYTFNQMLNGDGGGPSFLDVTGTLTTDGTIGAIAETDVVSFDIFIYGYYAGYDNAYFSDELNSASQSKIVSFAGVITTSEGLFVPFEEDPKAGFRIVNNGDYSHLLIDIDDEIFQTSTGGVVNAEVPGPPYEIASVVTPEPGGLMLLGTGLLGVVGLVRRRIRGDR